MDNKPIIHLLLVDDDQVDRLTCKRALAQHPEYEFVVLEAETGAQGLELARTQRPDCILLDHNLPDFNGVEFLTELAGDSGEPPIPVVMLTGADNAMLAVEVLKLGALDYVVKGSERESLQYLPSVILRTLREHQTIQEKTAAEKQLCEAEAKYRNLVEQTPAITYIASLEHQGKLSYISPQIQQLGYPPEECLSNPDGLLKRVHTEDRLSVIEALSQTYQNHTPLHCEYRLVKRDGQVRWFLDEASVVRDDNGKTLFLQGILVDVTKDKEIEQELSYYRRHLETLVAQRTEQVEKQNAVLNAANANLAETLSVLKQAEGELRIAAAAFETQSGFIVADAHKVIVRVNQAFTRITGYTPEQVVGNTPFFLRSGLHDPAFYETLWAAVENDGFWEGELWNKHKNGELFPMWETITRVTDQEGQVTHYVGSFIDITAQKQAEKVLLDTQDRLENQVVNTQEELDEIKAETVEVNTALNVLLKHRNQDKSEAKLSLTLQVEETLLPLLKKLKVQSAGRRQSARLIDILESNLQQLVGSYGNSVNLDAAYRLLTPVEMQVAAMVRQGLASKVIAAALNSSSGTIEIHRKHIRKKLGLDAKINLHRYLLSLTE